MYQAIVGSRASKTNTEFSDVDILQLGNSPNYTSIVEKNSDVFIKDASGFVDGICLNSSSWISLMRLYPSEFLVDGNLVKFIIENRDKYVLSNTSILFNNSKYALNSCGYLNKDLWLLSPKPAILKTLLISFLNGLAMGKSPQEAMIPNDTTRSLIIGAKLNKWDEHIYEDFCKNNAALVDNVMKNRNFFDKRDDDFSKYFLQTSLDIANSYIENGVVTIPNNLT